MHLRSVQKAEAKLSTSIAKHCQVAHLLVLDRVPPTWPFEARTRQKVNRTMIGAACITSQPRYRKASCQAAYLESLSATLSVPNTIRRLPDTSEQPVAASLIFFLICSLLFPVFPALWHACLSSLSARCVLPSLQTRLSGEIPWAVHAQPQQPARTTLLAINISNALTLLSKCLYALPETSPGIAAPPSIISFLRHLL